MSQRCPRVLGAALVVAALSCSPDHTGPTAPQDLRPSLSITGTCSNGATAVGGFIKNWACGNVVRLQTPAGMTSAEVSALSSAVSRWTASPLRTAELHHEHRHPDDHRLDLGLGRLLLRPGPG